MQLAKRWLENEMVEKLSFVFLLFYASDVAIRVNLRFEFQVGHPNQNRFRLLILFLIFSQEQPLPLYVQLRNSLAILVNVFPVVPVAMAMKIVEMVLMREVVIKFKEVRITKIQSLFSIFIVYNWLKVRFLNSFYHAFIAKNLYADLK